MRKKNTGGNYKVGRGKPPLHTRFKKGKSGNELGRPKRVPAFEEKVEEILTRRQTVMIDGERTSRTFEELLITSILQNAIRCKNSKSIEIAMGWVGMLYDLRAKRNREQRSQAEPAITREALLKMTPEERLALYNDTLDKNGRKNKEDE
jgi:hypothetical protein